MEVNGPILQSRKLHKHFPVKRSAFSRHEWLRAVDGVDLTVMPNSVVSIVGESGCGKSTLARLLLRLIEPTSGEVRFKGKNILDFSLGQMTGFRRSVQMVFQDPFASLNPRRTVFETVSEPMKIHNLVQGSELRAKVAELLGRVGLRDVMDRYPHEFSGGQRQRVCIARALAVSPEVIVADEPLSALDVSIQAQIINLLLEIKRDTGIAFVFISHDLRVVRYLSDHVAVMYLGKVVESAPTEELFGNPRHPYTEVLLSSAPSLEPGGRSRTILSGEVPSPIDQPPGCPFHTRCPKAFEPCKEVLPLLSATSGRDVACHLWNAPVHAGK